MSNLKLFKSLPIGALFFRDPFNELESPSIKIADNQARNPKGATIEVNGGVLVFIHAVQPTPLVVTYEELFDLAGKIEW